MWALTARIVNPLKYDTTSKEFQGVSICCKLAHDQMAKNISFPPKSFCLPYQLPSLGMMLVWLNCVDSPFSSHPSFLRAEFMAGCVFCHPSRAPSGKDVTLKQWDDRFVFSGFLGSPEVEISSLLGWHPLTNRLEVATCKGERAKPA